MGDEKINGWNAEMARMVIASDFLLYKYRRISKNGRVTGSPYESLVFGKIYRLSGGMYGYCSLSLERMAYELGAGYDSILRAKKNLERDKYIFKTPPHKKDTNNSRTDRYAANMSKLYEDSMEWEMSDLGFDNDPFRKVRKNHEYPSREND